MELKASVCHDPDGNTLRYHWFMYREAGNFDGTLEIYDADSFSAWFTAPKVNSAKTLHIILAVVDNGEPPLTRYGRVLVTIEP